MVVFHTVIHHNLFIQLLPVSKDTCNFICFGSVWVVWHPVVYTQALVCVERDLCCQGHPRALTARCI